MSTSNMRVYCSPLISFIIAVVTFKKLFWIMSSQFSCVISDLRFEMMKRWNSCFDAFSHPPCTFHLITLVWKSILFEFDIFLECNVGILTTLVREVVKNNSERPVDALAENGKLPTHLLTTSNQEMLAHLKKISYVTTSYNIPSQR